MRFSTVFSFIANLSLAVAATLPWDGPSFSGDPAQIIRKAGTFQPHKSAEVVVLLDDQKIEIDKLGRRTHTIHCVFRFTGSRAAESDWAALGWRYSPWRQAKPEFKARVITANGNIHWLKAETISESPVRGNGESAVFSDDRILQAPLPAVADGAVAEYEIKVREHRPFFEQGISTRMEYRGLLPRQIRLLLEYPSSLPVRTKFSEIPESARSESSQKDLRRIAVNWTPPVLPSDQEFDPEAPVPSLAYSTAVSWNQVAAGYETIVENAIRDAGPSIERLIAGVPKGLPVPELAKQLSARLHDAVRYTGIEFGEMAIVPATPATALDRKFGDCKDKAALLVAMFRAFGVPARIALLESGVSLEDVDETLPGLSIFNHAIVYVPAANPIWIDATADTTPIPHLPPGDQGRLALIASQDTTQLIRIPEAPASANSRIVEVEMKMNPNGKGEITETILATGAFEAETRSSLSGIPSEDRKVLEAVAKGTYLSEKLGEFVVPKRHDWNLQGPYRVQFMVQDAVRAVAEGDEAAAGLFEHFVFDALPWQVLQKKKPEKPQKKNTILPQNHQSEYRYRVFPPAGFKLRTLPKPETLTWGPATYTRKFAVRPDGVIEASFRFESGKRVYTPEETEAVRAGIAEYNNGKPVVLQFLSEAAEAAALGDIKAAIAATQRSLAADPKSASIRVRLSKLLLQTGAGDSARREARTATELDAKSSAAFHALGWTLQHDSFGRRFTGNWDRSGSIAAHRKAAELDPKGLIAQLDLAILLEHNPVGERYAQGAELKEAESIYRKLLAENENTEVRNSLASLLLHSRQFDLLEKEIPHIDAGRKPGFEILFAALTKSSGQAMLTAQQFYPESSTRGQHALDVARTLLQLREYPKAVDLFKAASRLLNNSQVAAQAELFSKVKRVEELAVSPTDPKFPVQALLQLMFAPSGTIANDRLTAIVAKEWAKSADPDSSIIEFQRAIKPALALFQRAGFSRPVAADLVATSIEFTVEGDPAIGHRVTTQAPGGRAQNFFVVKDKATGQYKLIGGVDDVSAIGQKVLDLAESGDLETARKWLDWTANTATTSDSSAGSGRPPFALLWSGVTPETRGRNAILAAGAAMLGQSENSARAIGLLRAALGRTNLAVERNQISLALGKALIKAKAWKDLLDVAYRLEATTLFANEGFQFEMTGLIGLERWADIQKSAGAKLKADNQNIHALRALMQASVATKDSQSRDYAEQLSQALFASSSDRIDAAWTTLRTGQASKKVLDKLAEDQNPMVSPGHHYALGFLQLATKQQPEDAVRSLVAALDRDEFSSLDAQPWAMQGKILETVGLSADAAAAYEKAKAVSRKTSAGTWAVELIGK